MLKKGDVYLICILAILSILGYCGYWGYKTYNNNIKPATITANIVKNGSILRSIRLDKVQKSEEYTVPDHSAVILIEKGRICFKSATCHDKICVHTGWLSHSGDTAICLPNQLMIKITGEKSDVDGTTF